MDTDTHIVGIDLSHLPEVWDIMRDGFGSKKCCLCVPVQESLPELQKRYYNMPESKRKLGAVAVDDQGTVLGYIQMTQMGLPSYPHGLHECKEDEMYIEMVAVSSQSRGKGVGTMLLQWCEKTALDEPQIRRLTLEVLNGNRATGLYERFGFIPKEQDGIDKCCGAFVVCVLFGRPYGFCDPQWGSIEMEMTLKREDGIIERK